MRAVILRSVLVIGVGALVLAGVLYVASTVDARPPEVVSVGVTQPAAGEPDVALATTSIEVAFSEPVEPDSAEAAVMIEPEVDGTVSWSGNTLIFTPTDGLELDTDYAVSVGDGVRDLSGNEIAELPPAFEFRTAGRPAVVMTDPEDGADEVATDDPIEITFSTLMDTASVEAALRLRPTFAHELRWSGELLEIVPTEPMRPGTSYELVIDAAATDAAGARLGDTYRLAYTTAEPGLRAEAVVPADGIDGIAIGSAMAVLFDEPIDPGTLNEDAWTVEPDVAGTLDVVQLPGEPAEGGAGRMLRFTPSGPLSANTTYTVEVTPEVASADERGLAETLTWSFTTGTPAATLSNQITFLSDRSGITNVWATNPDGTGQRQVSAELTPVVDYAVSPDGTSLVVADGRRLVYMRPSGEDRRVLTTDEHIEYDPAYGPNGRRLAFGRAEAATGRGLGLWQWEVGGGAPEPIELPADLRGGPSASPGDEDESLVLRAPRYSPDGLALAYVDLEGRIGILELPAQRLTQVDFDAASQPYWLPDSSAVLLNRAAEEGGGELEVPVLPLAADDVAGVARLGRSGVTASAVQVPEGSRVVAIGPDGTIAIVASDDALSLATDLADTEVEPLVDDANVMAAAFAPDASTLVVALAPTGDRAAGAVELVDRESGERTDLAPAGRMPRWLP